LFGKLHLAPVDNPPRVLDIGTGTGIWATDFATMHPASEVVGTDVSPIQPVYLPPNCRFEIDDLEDGLVFADPFDYVHLRYMCATVDDFPKLIGRIYHNLNPGGYVELQDYAGAITSIDDAGAGTDLERWKGLLLEGTRRMGRDVTQSLRYRQWLEEAGFTGVYEQRYALPNNAWAQGRDKKTLGLMQMANMLQGLDGMSKRLFVGMLGMKDDEVEELLDGVKRDFQDRRLHYYFPMLVVYGRKPLLNPGQR